MLIFIALYQFLKDFRLAWQKIRRYHLAVGQVDNPTIRRFRLAVGLAGNPM